MRLGENLARIACFSGALLAGANAAEVLSDPGDFLGRSGGVSALAAQQNMLANPEVQEVLLSLAIADALLIGGLILSRQEND